MTKDEDWFKYVALGVVLNRCVIADVLIAIKRTVS